MLPVLNEEACIDDALERLRAQTYTDIEVLVVDGGSTDATRSIVTRHATEDARVHLVNNPRRLQSAGLNEALEQARGEILVRVDGHSFVEDDYVENCVRILDQTGADVVGGRMVARPVDEPVARGVAIANEAVWGAGPAQFHRIGEAGPVDTVYLGTFLVDRLRSLGGWAEDVGVNEDYEMNLRIREAGGTVWFDPELGVGYRPRRTLQAVAKQYFRYGRSKATVMRRHPASTKLRQLIPTAVAPAGLVALLPVAQLSIPGGALVIRLTRLAIGAHGVGLAVAGQKSAESTRSGVAASAAAWLMHWTWSAGFWFGLLRPFPSAATIAAKH